MVDADVLAVLAALAFLTFVAALSGRLVSAEGQRGQLSSLAFGAGAATAVVVAAAATVGLMGAAQRSKWGDVAAFDPHTTRTTNFLGEVLFETGLAFASLLVAATSVVARRHALFPAWLVWGGFVVAAALFLGFAFIVPVFGLLAWTVAESVVLVRS